MQLICSDTNVWIDFAAIDIIELPFRLPYTYLMNTDAVNDEFLSPPGLGEKLVSFGLVPAEMTLKEFDCAEEYGWKYTRLPVYDRVALAMAKCRGIPLLTGDKALRRAAGEEGVEVIGTRMDIRSGRIEGENCHDTEKVRRFRALYPDAEIDVFYSDSLSDSPLAELAGKAFLVKKGNLSDWRTER